MRNKSEKKHGGHAGARVGQGHVGCVHPSHFTAFLGPSRRVEPGGGTWLQPQLALVAAPCVVSTHWVQPRVWPTLGAAEHGTTHEGGLTILRVKAISNCKKAKPQHKGIEHSAWAWCQGGSKTIQRQAGFCWRARWQALGKIYSGNQEFSKATHPRPFVPKGGLVNVNLK